MFWAVEESVRLLDRVADTDEYYIYQQAGVSLWV